MAGLVADVFVGVSILQHELWRSVFKRRDSETNPGSVSKKRKFREVS